MPGLSVKGDNMKKILAIMLLLSLALSACVQVGPGEQGKNTISASADSQQEVAPNQAEIYFTVQTNDTSPQAAQDANSNITSSVIDALKGAGVSSDDIETLNYNLYPNQVYVPGPLIAQQSYPQPGRTEIQGYIVTNTIKVTTKDFSKVGKLLSVAVNAGVNQIQSVQFSLTKDKENEIKSQVLSDATKTARLKAQAIADGLGVKLGDLVRVSESNFNFVPYRYGGVLEASALKTGAPVPPISPQKITVSASISVEYAIR